MALTMRQSASALRTRAPAVSSRRSALVVRASAEEPKASAPSATPAPVVQDEVAFEAVPKVQPVPVAAAAAASSAAPSLFEAMSFASPYGPETMNGRLAMIGVLAAVGAEFATGESFVTQFANFTPIVLATWALISVASLVPVLKGADLKATMGPFTPQIERINGWAAMLGLSALIIIETVKGSALF